MKDGRVLMGVVRAEGFDEARVMDTDARQTVVRRSEIAEFQPSTTSVMPQGLAAAVGEQGMRDLLSFLATVRPAPAQRD
jgi:putative heme-binding domain-containing protein